jgi:hypothetical protein
MASNAIKRIDQRTAIRADNKGNTAYNHSMTARRDKTKLSSCFEKLTPETVSISRLDDLADDHIPEIEKLILD